MAASVSCELPRAGFASCSRRAARNCSFRPFTQANFRRVQCTARPVKYVPTSERHPSRESLKRSYQINNISGIVPPGRESQALSLIGSVALVSLTAATQPSNAAQMMAVASIAQPISELADLDAKTAGVLAGVLRPLLSVSILLFIVRIILSWYPQIDGKKLPWSIAVAPTEPVLKPTRQVIQPVGGVDVSPIVWVAFLSFVNEILLGPQGILNLLQRKLEI